MSKKYTTSAKASALIIAELLYEGIKFLVLNAPAGAIWLAKNTPKYAKKAMKNGPPLIKSFLSQLWADKISRKQLKTFYKPIDYIQSSLHLALASTIAVLAGIWAGPAIFFPAAGLAGALTLTVNIGFESLLPKIFKRRMFDAGDLPNTITNYIKALTIKADLRQTPTVYDLALAENDVEKQTNVTTQPAQMQRIMNAAAVSLTKPSLLISKPIIEGLQPQEMEAVLAHEFTHLGAKHSWMHFVAGWMQTTTMFTAMGGFGHVLVKQGMFETILAVTASIAVPTIGNKFLPKPDERVTRDGMVKPRTRRTQMAILAAQEIVTLAIMAAPSPLTILPAAVIEHVFFWAANITNKSLSRHLEFQADRGATRLGADPLALITSLRKLELNLKENEPELAESVNLRTGSIPVKALKRVESLFHTHPETLRRCWQLAKISATQGQSQEKIIEALDHEIILPRPIMDSMKENPTAGMQL